VSAAVDLDHLRRWIGRTVEREAVVDPWPARALAATLDRERAPAPGEPLPPFWHQLYALEAARPGEVGRDGHRQLGGFLPPLADARRMWAGGRLSLPGEIRIGETVRRRSEVVDVQLKSGASGPLVFVLVRHEIDTARGLAATEEHDIVYRLPPVAAAPPPVTAPAEAAWRREHVADPVLLFRFSALTFNGHRIHYDRTFAIEVEGYSGLVVHGPLLATLLLELVGREVPGRRVERFAFRARAPLTDGEPFAACGAPAEGGAKLWIARGDGALAMAAEASFSA
jgi:3-methylfumaryl-CoA hydratase